MFRSLLIANRGEIACRIISTARRMGLRTIAVYSDSEPHAMHVELADEAFRLGPAPAAESYLHAERILEIARRAGADALHPGYGFLAENARFAQACGAAGVVFVGPPAAAIRAMGSKSAALDLMERAGVPVLPGYRGAEQSDAVLMEAAVAVGFPLMVKPAAGGGGKGMRIVNAQDELKTAIASARREAISSFGDGELLLERYLKRARHVEVQVFADKHSNTLHFHERDCSIQRRHQKIIEEAPAPGLDDDLRARMGDVAVEAAKTIGYVGAGTVEFLLDAEAAARAQTPGDPFYFMEMNTRLQVEHPVTEMVLDLDLVEWQLRVASGEVLPSTLANRKPEGHAVEARIYAEDPARGFLPASGRVSHLRTPEGEGLRVDSGVRRGDAIGVHYDPMIAKVIAHGRDRGEAVRRLRRALDGYEILGVTTNLSYLSRILAHPEYANGGFDTGFVERLGGALTESRTDEFRIDDAAFVAVLFMSLERRAGHNGTAPGNGSPWAALSGFRLNADAVERVPLGAGGEIRTFTITHTASGARIACGDASRSASGHIVGEGRFEVHIDDRRLRAAVVRDGDALDLWLDGKARRFHVVDPSARRGGAPTGHQHLTAPMPGKIIAVLVENGTTVTRGQPLVTMEAMKMEHTVTAPFDGVVEAIRFGVGELVSEGADLIHISARA